MDSYRKIKDQIFTKNIGLEGRDMDIITDQVKKTQQKKSQNRQIRQSRHNTQDKIDIRLESTGTLKHTYNEVPVSGNFATL